MDLLPDERHRCPKQQEYQLAHSSMEADTRFAANNSLPFTNRLQKSSDATTAPKAYLNWAVFDRDYKQDLSRSGYKSITINGREDGTNKAHEQLKPDNTIEIAEPGLYIFG